MMLDRQHPTTLRFGNAVRARFGKLTAFRLGYLAGESGEIHASPYDDERGRQHFAIGVEAGRESMQRRAERDHEKEKH